jgi:hypothetical protein
VLVSQIFVCQRDSRTPRRIKVAHVRRDRTRQRRERCYNVNVTVKLTLSLISSLCTQPKCLRRALGQNDLDLGLVHHRSRDVCHDGNTDDVSLIRCIPAHGVLEWGVEPESERIVPSTQKRIPGPHFKDAVLNGLATLGHRRSSTQMGRGYIPVQVIEVRVSHSWREV